MFQTRHEKCDTRVLFVPHYGWGRGAQPRESRSKWVNWLHLNCHIYQSSSILTSIYLLLLVDSAAYYFNILFHSHFKNLEDTFENGHLKKLCPVLNGKRNKHLGEENISKYFSQRPWVRFWGPEIAASSCTHLGAAYVMKVITIDI